MAQDNHLAERDWVQKRQNDVAVNAYLGCTIHAPRFAQLIGGFRAAPPDTSP